MDDKLKQPYEGQLIKFTNVVKGWQSRWFILNPERGSLEYYLSQGDRYEKVRGSIQLAGAVISPSDEDSLTFTVSPAVGESYKLRAHDTKDRQMWINRLRIIAEMHTRAIAHHHPPLAPREHRIREPSLMPSRWEGPGYGGGLDVIDAFTQVAEILEESHRQQAALAQSIEELPAYAPGMRCIDPNLLLIKATSQATLLCLDHCLTALRSRHSAMHYSTNHQCQSHQGAAATSHQNKSSVSLSPLVSPLMGRSPRPQRRNTAADLSGFVRRRSSPIPLHKLTSGSPVRSLQSSVKSRIPAQSSSVSLLSSSAPVKAHHRVSSSPTPSVIDLTSHKRATSLTSSKSNLEKAQKSCSSASGSEASDSSCGGQHSSSTPKGSHDTPLKSCEGDSEEISDCEEGSNPFVEGDIAPVEEGQRSVIMHIISQLRLGMDLTRVTLPTFILEKRSLLEMFADFLGHPDLFLRISTCETPEERILAVVKWYLTSIHVGRQGSIAKKPYNPIIGEVFHCTWRVPVEDVLGSNEDTTGTIDNQFYTIKYSSEQVSHHPPVSAFYIECPEKEMCINAHIWTKSKFMGMSVGVNLVGSISLFLGKFNETYNLGMPSAYARNVLMEPWVELGGRINIHCPQSGFSAPIVFHTKPFYGGRLHRVTCEVKNGSANVISRVQGEWDSFLEFSYDAEKTETINIKKLRVAHRKRVRPLEKQAENESRCLWLDVTRALARSDLDTATNHKKALEDRQRADEQRRAVAGTHFPTKLFSSSSGSHSYSATDLWVYRDLPKYAKNLFLQNSSSGS